MTSHGSRCARGRSPRAGPSRAALVRLRVRNSSRSRKPSRTSPASGHRASCARVSCSTRPSAPTAAETDAVGAGRRHSRRSRPAMTMSCRSSGSVRSACPARSARAAARRAASASSSRTARRRPRRAAPRLVLALDSAAADLQHRRLTVRARHRRHPRSNSPRRRRTAAQRERPARASRDAGRAAARATRARPNRVRRSRRAARRRSGQPRITCKLGPPCPHSHASVRLRTLVLVFSLALAHAAYTARSLPPRRPRRSG